MYNDKIIKVEIEDYILYDRINEFAIEYATTTDYLINLAIKRLFNDVEFFRELRKGKATIVLHQDGQK